MVDALTGVGRDRRWSLNLATILRHDPKGQPFVALWQLLGHWCSSYIRKKAALGIFREWFLIDHSGELYYYC